MSRVFPYTSFVLYRFLRALQQNRAQSRLLYLLNIIWIFMQHRDFLVPKILFLFMAQSLFRYKDIDVALVSDL